MASMKRDNRCYAHGQKIVRGQANWPVLVCLKTIDPEVHSYGSVLHALVRGRMNGMSGSTAKSFCLIGNSNTKAHLLVKQKNKKRKGEDT